MLAKLIRDKWAKIPKPDTTVVYVTPGGPEHRMALASKLYEEAGEVAGAPWDVNEYADLFEVAITLALLNGIQILEINAAMEAKRAARGGFDEGAIYYASREGHLQAKKVYG